MTDIFRLRNTKVDLKLPHQPAYTDRKPINAIKMKDIKKTLTYVSQEKLHFCNNITSWPVSNVNNGEEEVY